ncbi:MAG: site-2 protease family protein [Planctomycetaceae bacterium]|nr:site-2 protease family protein [Planctomycetaceae bacterium]
MGWSFRIGRIFGIDLYVHATFFLLPVWVMLTQYARSQSVEAALVELLFVLIVFAIIVLHECGHALAARQFGVPTRDITLLPIGGVARLERMPENPLHEFLVAIAGPAVNVALALLLLAWLIASGRIGSQLVLDAIEGPLDQRLFAVNVLLVVFNMIPAFPMDGGRVLRSLLAMAMNPLSATRIAAAIGQMFAVLLGLWGLFFGGGPFLVLIALFVWVGAAQESSASEIRFMLRGVRVRQAMISDFRAVGPYDSLDAVAQHVLAGFQQDFPVVEDDHVVGIITRSDLLKALADSGRHGQVADVMQRKFVAVRPDDALTDAFAKLQSCECYSMPVIQDGQLVGLLTSENVGEYLMIDSAIRQQFPRPSAPVATARQLHE